MLQVGDVVLVRKIGGFSLVSDVIVWWQNSKIASHVGVVTDPEKLEVFDARMLKKSSIKNLEYFFDGKHLIHILRYSPELTTQQQDKIRQYLLTNLNVEYDNESILSIISNKDIESKKKLNCAEATLQSYHNADLLSKRNTEYILPHTFWEFYMADRFTLVKSFYKPEKKDLSLLLP